jgi:hypothetical protein
LNPSEIAQQTATELLALVAPIALYPDAVVAQILSASTFAQYPGSTGVLRFVTG